MPVWFRNLLPARAWAHVCIPLSLTLLSVAISGVSVSCSGQTIDQLSMGQYLSRAGQEDSVSAYTSLVLLPYGISATDSSGMVVSARSSLILGLIAMLAGFVAVNVLAHSANASYWLIVPYWLIGLAALLLLQISKGGVSWSPTVYYVLAVPFGCALAARVAALFGTSQGWFDARETDTGYGSAVGEALVEIKGLSHRAASTVQHALPTHPIQTMAPIVQATQVAHSVSSEPADPRVTSEASVSSRAASPVISSAAFSCGRCGEQSVVRFRFCPACGARQESN